MSLDVRSFQEYIIDLLLKIESMGKIMSDEDTENFMFQNVSQRKPDGVSSLFFENSSIDNFFFFFVETNGML